MAEKQCICCLRNRPLEDFRADKRDADGRKPYCKRCRKESGAADPSQWRTAQLHAERGLLFGKRADKLVCWLTQVCGKCGEERPYQIFGIHRDRRRTVCNPCRNKRLNEHRAAGLLKTKDPDRLKRRNARAAARRKILRPWTKPERRTRLLAQKRAYRERMAAEQGRVLLPRNGDRGIKANLLAERNARKAWRWWLKTCPDWWLRAYYRATGKPWNNPRVAPADRWRIRYWLDPAFRAKEIEKVQKLKVKRAARIAANNDGTLTGEMIVSLFRVATHCIYCLKAMRSVEKSLDHVTPLSAGGAHSIHNVVVCCKRCNTKKGQKTAVQFRCADTTSSISAAC